MTISVNDDLFERFNETLTLVKASLKHITQIYLFHWKPLTSLYELTSFSRSLFLSSLLLLVQADSGSGIFSCPDCLKIFHSKSKLKQHSLIHTGQRPFGCTICLQTFNVVSNLRRHMRTQHKVKK